MSDEGAGISVAAERSESRDSRVRTCGASEDEKRTLSKLSILHGRQSVGEACVSTAQYTEREPE